MPHAMSRRLVRPTFCLALASAVGVGCAPGKTVTLPVDAGPGDACWCSRWRRTGTSRRCRWTRTRAGRRPRSKLDMSDDAHYRVEAHRVLCAPNAGTQVRLEPLAQTD